MGKKTPPFKHYPEWTEAKFWAFIRSGLRAKWSRWPPKFVALKNARRSVKGQRHKYEYQCYKCRQWFKQKEVEVDHAISAGKLNTYKDLPKFVERLFVSENELTVLCKPCHKAKTLEERE